ncbi:hypothetical protein BDY21DRAFT_329675 [Lineolata rhizophorae]|uniref:LysM domain-containing protein n=1 Tax=Lineolata rhizophorae TaxID=578093 RepID=A0A6A6PCT7_9PEZI|nr:hypothetical protein BDY21DRAFT_329675 [Lineolata rhizophorae]
MSATTPEACCTCATLLSARPPAYTYDEKHPYDEKRPDQPPTMTPSRRLPCCRRAICAPCTTANPRFATYCPFCQVSTGPSALPATGLRLPPAYSPPSSLVRARGSRRHVNEGHRFDEDEQPPAYTPRPGAVATPQLDEKASSFADDEPAAPDVLHFLDPERDSVQSLALRYGVPAAALRRANGLFADHLLAARRTALIPGEYYKGGVSLSPRPVDGEEEERRKGCVRRFMVGCKVAE